MNAIKRLSAGVVLVLSLFAATVAFAHTHVDALREEIVAGLQARLPQSRIWVNTMCDSLCNGHMDYKRLRGKPIVAPPAVSLDVLEPSVLNEVDHALDRAPTGAATNNFTSADLAFARLYVTNGLSATDVALRLVTAQRADGTWRVGTNDVTTAAVQVLRSLVLGNNALHSRSQN